MSLGMIIILGVVVVALIIGLFAMMTDPKEVDAEEHSDVVDQVAAGIPQHHKGTLD